MKVEDIEVGGFYINDMMPNVIYLGIGLRKLHAEDSFYEKGMIVLDSNSLGSMVQPKELANPNFWDSFHKLEGVKLTAKKCGESPL